MKKAAIIPAVISDAALIFCGAFAALTAAPTAYSISFHLAPLAAAMAIMSLILALWCDLERGGIVFGFVFIFGGLMLFAVSSENVIPGGRLVVYRLLSSIFSSEAFEMKAEYLHGMTSPTDAATWFLGAAGAVISLLLAVFNLKWRRLIPSLLIPLPFLVISLVFTNFRPAVWCIVMLLIYIGGVLMTLGIRRRDRLRGGLFTGLIIPILLAVLIAFTVIMPEESYAPIPYEARRELLGRRFGYLQDGILRIYSHNPEEYDLSREGERTEADARQLFVSATRKGSYLLRSHSYGLYSEGKWLSAEEYDGGWSSIDALMRDWKSTRERLSVFGSMTDERYVPYGFINPGDLRLGESFIRSLGETAYSWEFHPYIRYTAAADRDGEDEYYRFALEHYTLPEGEEKDLLLALADAAGLAKQKKDIETALAVADHVRESGEYDLAPGGTPRDRDFVEYFLTEGHAGYCVHFASATTALLQAMGVPARYTVGCYASVPETGVWYEVPQKNAHAWTEIYVKGIGWIPIESTPGFLYDYTENYFDTEAQGHAAATPAPTEAPVLPSETVPARSYEPEGPEVTEPPELSERPKPPRGGDEPEVTKPPKPAGNGQGKGEDSEKTPLSPVPIIIAAVVAWFAAGELLRKRREDSFRKKDPRRAVLRMVRYYGRLKRLFRLPYIPELDDMAKEAAFSDHDMSAKRDELYEFICDTRDEISGESALKWILFRRLLFVL